MSDLPTKLEVSVWGGTGRTLTFERTEDVLEWANRETSSWEVQNQIRTNWLKQSWDEQRNWLTNIANSTRRLDEFLNQTDHPGKAQQIQSSFQSLRQLIDIVSRGTRLTSEHPNFGYIAQIAESDMDAAAVLMVASQSDGAAIFANHGPLPLDAVARLGVAFIKASEQGKAVDVHRKALAALENQTGEQLTALRKAISDENERSEQIDKEHAQRVIEHGEQWADVLKKVTDDWTGLKRVYDEQLSLQAPTNYWTTRAGRYKHQAIGFAIAFGLALAVMIGIFAWLGIPELRTSHGGSSWVAILPVIIPTFAGVWVLRIFGRQLSESLMIMKDAEERQTLVKTFLALMRDETTGKAVVTEADRVLILQALFRQSRVTATDDSPPLNSGEAILKSMGR